MALNETDKAFIRDEIRKSHERHGINKLWVFLKDWGGILLAGAVIAFALTQWSDYVAFKTHVNDTLPKASDDLKTVWEKLSKLEVAVHDLEKAQTTASLNSATQAARSRQTNVANNLVHQAAGLLQSLKTTRTSADDLFFDSASASLDQLKSVGLSEAETHGVKLALAEYRSAINPVPVLPTQTAPRTEGPPTLTLTFKSAYRYAIETPIVLNGPPQLLLADGNGGLLDATAIKPDENLLVVSPRSIDVDPVIIENFFILGGTQTLDYVNWANVTFVNTHIKYRGGPTRFTNVHFVNCTFDFPANKVGSDFAQYAALQPREKKITVG